MNLVKVVPLYLAFLLFKRIHGGGAPVPLKAEVIPPGQDDSCQCGQVNDDKQSLARIVGGSKTPPNKFPWLAGLYGRSGNVDWEHNCGGSLISSQHILTAAHCVKNVEERVIGPGDVRVLLGGHSRKYQSQNLRTVSNISIHKDYIDVDTTRYDIIQQVSEDLVLAKPKEIGENDLAILTLETKVRLTFSMQIQNLVLNRCFLMHQASCLSAFQGILQSLTSIRRPLWQGGVVLWRM